ncbi:MAG: hypothetical protein AAFW47_04470 [Pseudomonadota bacterium]
MIISVSAEEIRSSLKGALKILFREPDALSKFNLTPEGFWNSFQAIWILLIPVGLAALAGRQALMEHHELTLEEFQSGLFFAVRIVGLGIEWVFMPIVLWLAADVLGIRTRYGPYVIARNWGSVIAGVAMAVPAVCQLAGLVNGDVAALASLMLVGFVLVYHYRIARVTLEKEAPFCLGLVSVDFLVGIVLGEAIWSAFGGSILP